MLDWLQRILGTGHGPQPVARKPEPQGMHVLHDHDHITLKVPEAPDAVMAWSNLEAVAIVSGDATADPPELYWLLHGPDRRRPLLIPMGIPGEHDLVHAMQARLDGFDNMAVVEAMSARGRVGFKIWDVESSDREDT